MEKVHEGTKGRRVRGRYLHVGEGAGQGAGTRPPLLLQSPAQHLKLPLLLPHGGQQGGRTCTLLHSHTESRAQDRTGPSPHSTGTDESNTRIYQRTDRKPPTYTQIKSKALTQGAARNLNSKEAIMKFILN